MRQNLNHILMSFLGIKHTNYINVLDIKEENL